MQPIELLNSPLTRSNPMISFFWSSETLTYAASYALGFSACGLDIAAAIVVLYAIFSVRLSDETKKSLEVSGAVCCLVSAVLWSSSISLNERFDTLEARRQDREIAIVRSNEINEGRQITRERTKLTMAEKEILFLRMPRVNFFRSDKFTERLMKMNPVKVMIYYMPTNRDSFFLANSIMWSFNDARWLHSEPIPVTEKSIPLRTVSGGDVTIGFNTKTSDTAQSVGKALLSSAIMGMSFTNMFDPNLPDDTIEIFVNERN